MIYTHGTIKLHQLSLGPMANFVYILQETQSGQALVVDPAWSFPQIQECLDQEGLTLSGVYLTHTHHDHLNALSELLKYMEVPVYVSEKAASTGLPAHLSRPCDDDELIMLGDIEMRSYLTPGHSPCGQCLSVNDLLITGDTIFIDGCGRCDLTGSEPKAMFDSLQSLKSRIDASSMIYCGHNYGPSPRDTFANQCQRNRFLNTHNLAEFLSRRMG